MLKNTAQRIAIKEILDNSKEHPTASDIYKKTKESLPYITKPTVYNTLNTLLKKNEIQQIHSATTSKRFDPNPIPHPHLHCLSCNRVVDIELQNFPRIVNEINQKFPGATFELSIHSYCKHCKK